MLAWYMPLKLNNNSSFFIKSVLLYQYYSTFDLYMHYAHKLKEIYCLLYMYNIHTIIVISVTHEQQYEYSIPCLVIDVW